MTSTIELSEPSPGVRVVTLSRPEAANALNTAMGEELLALWTALAADPTIRVVVLTGAGRFFCAGADLKERDGMSDQAWSDQHVMFEAMIRAQLACPFPIIAAVNGAAMGGGAEMALACDFAWVADTAKMGLPEVGLGIIPGLGGTQFVTRAAGERRAAELLMSGLPVDAAQALEFGLVNRVVPAAELMTQVLQRAEVIASKAPLSVKALKAVVRGGAALPLDQAMELELSEYNRLFRTADRREGVAAFNQKRAAVFKGS
ncbi:enoyl-CoA hydratase/isomerase family protein [Phenylobacterium sp.]|uniref:enoyl-CoA hydratase/isomerase family protein n=1 Tax=Phenylobacterium sp. TaxID=1871053 RepID=UPI00273123BA|nr:enoyl-CoA hydratase-related protein [Phenylobacterium sp.]MDP1600104.1 enoyl-CoA hydratase-related protein [Phenylobacterium sp.]MDP3594002.1 enoyl-CoA hydratase-related protein [Phenylobacterium sp.]